MLALVPALIAQQPQQVSLCEVMRRPASYTHRLSRIPADILLALPHGAMLIDKNCPKAGLRLGYDLSGADPSVTYLVPSILNDCTPGPRPETVPGTFIGRLVYSAEGRIELRLLSVSELGVHPCEKPKLSNPLFTPERPVLPAPRSPLP